jgi:hypothetical protein
MLDQRGGVNESRRVGGDLERRASRPFDANQGVKRLLTAEAGGVNRLRMTEAVDGHA